MLQLRLLGAIDLRTAEGDDPVRGLLARPKRLALLSYLAAGEPGQVQPRDRLLGLFWPESSETRARNALHQAVHVLRRELGEGVVLGGRDGVRVDPGRLRCDVADLRAALAERDHEAVTRLYRGDLLPGFFLSGCPAFERWVEEEREGLRRAAVGAALQLARAAAEAGHPREAVERLRAAAVWAPYEEALTTELVERLAESGQPVAARREYAAYARRLERDLQLEPGPELKSLEERLAAATAAPAPSREARVEAPPTPAGPTIGRDGRPRFPWRVAAAGVLGLAVVGGVMGAGLTLPAGRQPQPEASTFRVRVQPFEGGAAGELTGVAAALPELIATRLATSTTIRPVSDPAGTDPRRGGTVDGWITGRVVEVGGRAEATVTLRDDAGPRAVARAEIDVADSAFAAADRIARMLLAGHHSGGDATVAAAGTATGSLVALETYLMGERAFRGGHYRRAYDLFRRALREDSLFGLAAFRLVGAADRTGEYAVAQQARRQAWELRATLPERERLLVVAEQEARGGASPVPPLRMLVDRFPRDPEIVSRYADALFHSPQLGARPEDIRPLFERVLRHDSMNADALLHLARLAAVDGRRPDLEELVARALPYHRNSDADLELRALRAVVTGDRAEMRDVLRRARDLDAEPLERLVYRTATYTGDFVATRPLAELMTAPDRSVDLRAAGFATLAFFDAARGRFRAAEETLANAARYDSRLAAAARGFLRLAPLRPPSSPDPVLGQALARPLAPAEARPALATHVSLRLLDNTTRRLLAALLASPGSDPRPVGMEGIPSRPPNATPGIVERIDGATRLREAGRPADALRLLGPDGRPEGTDPAGLEVLLRADLLRDVGRHEDALRWYGTLVHEVPFSMLVLPALHLRRGQLMDRLGDSAGAAAGYRRFIDLWEDADPELQPLVTAARRALTDLQASGPGDAPGRR